MMDSVEYLHLQMELEGLQLNQEGLITSLGLGPDDPPLIIIAHTRDGHTLTYFHETLPAPLREELAARQSQVRFPKIDVLLWPLDAYGLRYTVGHYKTYVFPQDYAEADTSRVRCFRGDDPQVQRFGFDRLADRVYAMEQDGAILSACVSARQNAECAESWVFTAAEQRGRGLASLVVTTWAKQVRQEGIIPFYSHKMDNTASAHLANKLRLVPVFEEIGIERQA